MAQRELKVLHVLCNLLPHGADASAIRLDLPCDNRSRNKLVEIRSWLAAWQDVRNQPD